MKKYFLPTIIFFCALFNVQTSRAQTQTGTAHHELTENELIEAKMKSVQMVFDADSLRGFNEAAARQQAAISGAPKWEQAMFVAYAKRKFINMSFGLNRAVPNNPTPQVPCTNVDFETGTGSGWTFSEGTNSNSITMAGCCPSATTRYSIVGPGTDPSVPALVTVPAGAGNFTLKMGDGAVTGGYVVRASQSFNVTAANSVFIYRFAAVLEDAGHACTDQPYFNISFSDCSGNPIPCGAYNVVPGSSACSSGGDPSFQTAGAYKWKDWTTRSFDLTGYIGQCVTIEFTASDCAQGGHAGWAYVDCSCQPMTLSLNGNAIPVGQTNSYICQGSSNDQLCAPPGFTSYTWTGPGGVTGQTTQCVTANTTGSYSVTLGMAGASCSSPVLYSNFSYTQKPTAGYTYTVTPCAASSLVPFTDNSTTNGGAAIASYTWNWGDGTFGSGASPTHTFSSGSHTVQLKVNNGACLDSITHTFNVSAGPTASFTPTNLCVGNIANFVSTSTPTTGLVSQVWNFGDNSANGMGANTSHSYSMANTYTVKLVVTSTGGCKDSVSKPITVFAKPVISFTTSPVCFGTPTAFNNTSTIAAPGTISNWYWDFNNDGVVDNTTQSPSNTYTSTGNFTTELKATSSNGCSDSTTVIVKVSPVPTATFSPVNACMNNNVALNNTSSVAAPDNISLWSWNFGAGASPNTTSSNQNPPSLTYGSSGVKNITLTITSNNSCTATVTNTVNILPQPTAAFAVSSVCQGLATTYTDQSTPLAPAAGSVTAWAWDFTSDGTVDDNTASPSTTYGSSGTYTTSLIVTSSNGCKDTVKVPVNVWGHASVNFAPTNVCSGTASTFTDQTVTTTQQNTGNLQSWSWSFGDGGTSTSQSPVYTYTGSTTSNFTYNAQLAVTTSHGCKDSLTKVVNVYALPTASFTADSVCLNSASHLTDLSNGNGNALSGYAWDYNGDGVADVTGVANPNHVFPAYGNNLVTYTASTSPAAGLTCSNTVSQNVWVHPLPVPAFSFTNTCINAQPMNYDASGSSIPVGTNTTYAWNYGDGQNGNGTTTSHTYATAAVYNVTLTVTSNKGCVKTLMQQSQVYEKPHVNFSSAKTCLGNVTTFASTSAANSGNVVQWLWDFNHSINTIEGVGQQAPFTFNTAGTQTVSLVTVTDKNCRDTLTRQIYVNYVPKPQFTVDKPAGCPLLCVTFTDHTPPITGPAQIVNWTWHFGDGTSASVNSNAPQSNCYTNSSSSQLALFNVTLVATSDSACVDSVVKNNYITVYPVPIAAYTVNPNPGSVTEPLEYFSNQSQDFTKWWWGFGDGPTKQDSVNLDPTHYYSDANAATYPSQLIVANQYGCLDTARVNVEIGPEFVFYIPNCFSPGNGDGINDGFTGKGIGITKYEMWIFDRWGNMIYYADDINKPWDGRVQGKPNPVQQDVYVWKVKLIDVFSKKHDYVGHVTVLRGNGN